MNASTPTSIAAYLQALRQALHGADPALIQDALYDAEQHLRAELAARSELDEAVAIAQIVNSYGAPDEVAAAYRETESRVQAAMAMPRAPKAGTPSSAVGGAPPVGVLRRFFGVYGDVRSWTALFYCLLALFTGIFYFSFVTIGLSLSLGLSILIIGVPFFVAFIGSARLLALVEGRIVEAMTGERMPRRPVSPPPESSLLQRIGAMLKDWRTWSTLAYEALMLPLGLVYFSVTVTALAIGLALMLAALAGGLRLLGLEIPGDTHIELGGLLSDEAANHPLMLLLYAVSGLVWLTLTMHMVRAIARLHGMLAKRMLVHA
ncbi:MAG: hypothetical protein RLZZ473_2381 [Pseudomonadota bacterium]|jgi:uncharacterized membrane protein